MSTQPSTPKPPSEPQSKMAALATAILLIVMFVVAWKVPPPANFLCVLAVITLALVVLGAAIVRTPLGVLVNDLNVMSLSRLQLVAWTAVVLSAYFTYVILRIKRNIDDPHSVADPLAVQIDWHLWSLLGISTTSFVGSSLITSTKKDKKTSSEVVQKTAKEADESLMDVDSNRRGALYANGQKSDAKFTDMFQGDELVNTTHVDMAKVQMFFFTVVTIAVYVFLVVQNLRHPEDGDFDHLPGLPEGMIALLGISHAGYLGNKTITHTPEK